MKKSTSGSRRATPESKKERKTAWISQGFEQLLYDVRQEPKRAGRDYDVIIVGSGYGGAVAAAKLAGCQDNGRPIRVCLLERGKEYLPGMFPSRLADLPGHVRFSTPYSAQARGTREGLFDIRLGPDVCALVANGLGGGSLINAAVVEEPDSSVFDAHWPNEFKRKSTRDALYDRARALLGAGNGAAINSIKHHRKGVPTKFSALQRLAADKPFRAAALTIAMTAKANAAGVALHECKLCGDCATGCNHGAKDSLDVNLLVRAWRQGAKIYTGATVLRLERDEDRDGWFVTVVHTDERLRQREREPLKLRARNVVLAAGTFGSTEILLRSRNDKLKFSDRLGQRFSVNGDMIAVAYDQNHPVNAVADEAVPPDERFVGPTTTGIVDLRADNRGKCVIQELAVPASLRRIFEEIVTTSHTLHQLDSGDPKRHGREKLDPCAVDTEAISKSSVFAVMARDGAAGSLELIGGGDEDDGDGAVRVRWPQLRDRRLFRAEIDKLKKLIRESGTGGKILPSALWQLLPTGMQFLLNNKRGPLVTVHPLGGCPMGTDTTTGVVDYLGRVFDATSGSKKQLAGLVILDGAIVPTSLGINPALTIAALALYAIEKLCEEWRFGAPKDQMPIEVERPLFREPFEREPPRPTVVEFVERMSGKVVLQNNGEAISCVIELTLQFEKVSLADLLFPKNGELMPRTIAVGRGELRLFRENEWTEWREKGEPEHWKREETQSVVSQEDIVQLRAPITGHLTVLSREMSTPSERINRALWAWLLNRGMRDSWQWIVERWQGRGRKRILGSINSENDPSLRERYRQMRELASRAGEARLIEYHLTVARPSQFPTEGNAIAAIFQNMPNGEIRGIKRITYSRRSNPWRQLTEMALLAFPGLAKQRSTWALRRTHITRQKSSPVLKLDTRYLAQQGAPLLRVVEHRDQPSMLADSVSLLAYLCRVLLTIHAWSFRRPDTETPREPQRLPGMVPGLPEPEISELDVDRLPDGTPVYVRLTRYYPRKAHGLPVVMIHGYSTSGTTFAHHAVKPNLAQHFCERNRDVWILDLRTSSGMRTACHPWTFEDAALADLPAAFDYIHRTTGRKLDIVAHCMGAAMFSMAVLAPPKPGSKFFREREALPKWINKAVLSQIGPVVVMSSGNIFRAYLMKYLRRYLPLGDYAFRAKSDPSLVDLLVDRLLATLPYPEEDFDIENPPWPPWRRAPFVGTRHRMDATYGRAFNLADKDGKTLLDAKVLEYIDDLFGPINIETVSQAIDLTRMQVIASRAGRNEYVSIPALKERWIFPTLSIHGEDNGLADVATLARVQTILGDQAGCRIKTHRCAGFGHQDSLIGKHANEVFKVIFSFLE